MTTNIDSKPTNKSFLGFNLNQKYRLLHELNHVLKPYPMFELTETLPELKELRSNLRIHLSGLIYEDTQEWIDYNDIEYLKSELDKAERRYNTVDHNSPYFRRVRYTYTNLYNLFQHRCPHKNKKYESLKGSHYQVAFCQDCESELSGLEFKPSFLERNNIDLSVLKDESSPKHSGDQE